MTKPEGAQRELASEAERLRFIADASEALLSSLDYEQTLQNLADHAVPALGDWCAVDMLDDAGGLARLAVAHTDAEKVRLAHQLWERYPPKLSDPLGLPNVLRTGEPEMMPDIPDELLVKSAIDDEHLRIARALGLRSYVVFPLKSRGKTLGALTLVHAESGRRYSEESLSFIGDVARVAAIGVENARLYRRERQARLRAEAVLREVEKQSREVEQLMVEMRAAKERAERRVAELESRGLGS